MQNILKYHYDNNPNQATDLDYYRDLQFLVTDTSKTNEPNFFGHRINGYYDDTLLVNNVIYNKEIKTSLTPLIEEEKELFFQIDSLARVNDIKYHRFSDSRVLGWFKYVF